MIGLPELSKLVCDELVEGDHPERLVDGHADVLGGSLHDLLQDLTASFGREKMEAAERMHLEIGNSIRQMTREKL